MIFDLEDTTLRFEGKEIRFPAVAREALDTVAGFERPFTVAELPQTLDEHGRLVLVRRLVREGFLRICDAA